jgi:amidase
MQISRRHILSITAGASLLPLLSCATRTTPANMIQFDVEECSLEALQAALSDGSISSTDLVAAYVGRIERIDRAGPHLASVIELNPEALAIARALDAERAAGTVRGPLHGLPILIKDNIDSHDRMQTTAGSLALLGSRPARDAHVVERLRAAGAVLLGKTNLSEWANLRSSASVSGWSGRGGLTRNPYVLDRNASGSSSGSAVAVAASLCAAAVGTETDGSIISPSSVCGVVGLKPTVGLVSRSGIVPIAHSQDTAGPMARSVRDCALLLAAMTGFDPRDGAMAARSAHPPIDYATLDVNALKGARLGVVRQFSGFHQASDRVFASALDALRAAGAVLVEPVTIPALETIGDAELTVLLYEFKADLNAYLRDRRDTQIRTLADVIAFNEAHASQEMPWFGQDLLVKAEAKGPLSDADYIDARSLCLRVAGRDGIEAQMRMHNLDALIAPSGGPAWRSDRVLGDHFVGGSSTTPAAVAGTPSITVPAGSVQGLPIGLTFFAEAWSEARLLSLAYSFEQVTCARARPGYKASVDDAV